MRYELNGMGAYVKGSVGVEACVNYLLKVSMENKDIHFKLDDINKMSDAEIYSLYEETVEKLGTKKEADEYFHKWCRNYM